MTDNGAVFINFVLDKSGSMYSIRDDTIGGFNQFCQDHRKSGEELGQATKMSLTLFDTKYEVRYVATDIADVAPLDEDSYRPDGNTALFDAVGFSVRALEKLAPEGKVVFVIQTDGEENSSKDWNRESTLKLIEEKREKDEWGVRVPGRGSGCVCRGRGDQRGAELDAVASTGSIAHGLRAAVGGHPCLAVGCCAGGGCCPVSDRVRREGQAGRIA